MSGVDPTGRSGGARGLPDRAELALPVWRALVMVGFLACVGAGGLLVSLGQPPHPLQGIPVAVVGCLGAMFYPLAVLVLGRRRVLLDRDGFTVRGLFATGRYGWAEVSPFDLATVVPGRGMRQTYVVFDGPGHIGPFRAFHRFLTGKTHALPGGIEPAGEPGNAATVAAMMNHWRDRALAKSAR